MNPECCVRESGADKVAKFHSSARSASQIKSQKGQDQQKPLIIIVWSLLSIVAYSCTAKNMYISLDCYDTDDTARGTRVFLSTKKKRLSLYSMPFRLDLTHVLNDDNTDDDDDDDDDHFFIISVMRRYRTNVSQWVTEWL